MMRNSLTDRYPCIVRILIYATFKTLIEFAYIFAVSPTYSYLGFVFYPNIEKYIYSNIILFILLVLLPKTDTICGMLTNLFFTICCIPMLSFYWMADRGSVYMAYCVVFFLVLLVCIRCLRNRNLKIKIVNGRSDNYKAIIIILFIIYVVLCLYLGISRGGVDLRALSFSTIYDLRREHNATGTLRGYLVNWCAKALFPCLIAYFVFNNNRIKAATCVLLQLFLYLCYGSKAYLLSIGFELVLLVLGHYTYIRKVRHSYIIQLFFTFLLIPTFFIRTNNYLGKIGERICNIYAMRFLFEPARIEYGYFDYFTTHPKLHFSEGLIGKMFNLHYPYDEPIGFVLTRFMNGYDAVSNSNTGIVADSYSQAGLLGIIIIAILAAFLFHLIDSVCINLPNYIVTAALSYPIFMLNDNALITNLFTNGWALDVIILIILEGALRYKEEGSYFQQRAQIL